MKSFNQNNYMSNGTKTLLIFWYFMFTILVLLIGYYLIKTPNENNLFYLAWLGNSLIIYSLFTWVKLTRKLISAYILFLLSFFSFSFGQAFLFSLGITYEPFNLYSLYDNRTLLYSHYYTLIGLAFLHLGALIACKHSNLIDDKVSHVYNPNLIKAIKLVAWGLFLGSVLFYFQDIVSRLIISLNSGYMALYKYDSSSIGQQTTFFGNIFATLKMFFIPGIFLLVFIYKNNIMVRKILTSILLLAVFLSFLIGIRTEAAALLISFVLLWHTEISAFKGKKTVFLLMGAILLLTLFTVIGEVRGDVNRGVNGFITASKEIISDKNPIFNSIGEMGGSMFPLIEIMNLVPEKINNKYGQTYLSSLLAIFPSFLVDWIVPRISLANWLMLTLGMNYGPGFSLLAESYLNFSWGGAPFMFVLGYIFSKILNPQRKKGAFFLVENVFIAVMLYFFITAGRGDTLLLIRNIVFYSIIPYLLIKILANSLKKENCE
ncbi:O-antigen polysaccharide polymerase Wzy [Heyndrickxia sp. MSNUG]|uniref:O-antigen polysaccharide polymerase Wzy n=1 Tax=Heyndrickxia sp. MSNUG TaxID=3136677 RepID=UPI003C2F8799